jgi:myosin-7
MCLSDYSNECPAALVSLTTDHTEQGFPIHVPAEAFVSKYGCLARVMKKPLDPNPKEAVRQILTYINAPKTEWQVGHTKVGLCGYVLSSDYCALMSMS